MGIPSFYKHLLQTIVGITSKTRAKPNVFALDLNCAIYHCVKKAQRKQPFAEETRAKWESVLIQEVVAYIQQLVNIVQPTDCVYIAVDGVAPMAKIRQQRVRRFKSAVQAEEEARTRATARGVAYVATERWDTNAITPGTAFMAALAVELRAYAKRATTKGKRSILVSPADEAGEGEQKIMEYIRKTKPAESVVYGLDADLIVLALLTGSTQGVTIDLFREEVEFNGAVKEDRGVESFLYLNMGVLANALWSNRHGKSRADFLIDFVALMNLLGNDFVPHGMALKIRDEGIEKLLHLYAQMKNPLLLLQKEKEKEKEKDKRQYNPAGLKELFAMLAEQEAAWMLKGIQHKLKARVGGTGSRDAEDIALTRLNDQPVVWAAEKPMIVDGQLHPNWTAMYDEAALWGSSKAEAAYVDALAWTFAYYNGEPVDTHWYYPWLLPPRFASLSRCLSLQGSICAPAETRAPLRPLEQLAMVLPKSSFSLLPKEYAALPTLYPHAWPTAWGLFSFGRRFLWECEPLIPLIQPHQIVQWVESME